MSDINYKGIVTEDAGFFYCPYGPWMNIFDIMDVNEEIKLRNTPLQRRIMKSVKDQPEIGVYYDYGKED